MQDFLWRGWSWDCPFWSPFVNRTAFNYARFGAVYINRRACKEKSRPLCVTWWSSSGDRERATWLRALGLGGREEETRGWRSKTEKEKEWKKWGGWKELHEACFQPWTRSRLMKGKEQRGIRQWTGDIRTGWIARNRKLPLCCHFAMNCLFIQMMITKEWIR